MKTSDIVGYDYNGDTYCRDCIKEVLPTGEDQAYDGWADATGRMDSEEFLEGIAQAFGIDRGDERTFESGDFPKVVFSSQIEGDENCGKCGRLID